MKGPACSHHPSGEALPFGGSCLRPSILQGLKVCGSLGSPLKLPGCSTEAQPLGETGWSQEPTFWGFGFAFLQTVWVK